jgi:hypothetical protein
MQNGTVQYSTDLDVIKYIKGKKHVLNFADTTVDPDLV